MEIAPAISPSIPAGGTSSAGSDPSRSPDDPFLALLAGLLATMAPPVPATPSPAAAPSATEPAVPASAPPVAAPTSAVPPDAAPSAMAPDEQPAPAAPPGIGEEMDFPACPAAVPLTADEAEDEASSTQSMTPPPEPRREPVKVERRPAFPHAPDLAAPPPATAADGASTPPVAPRQEPSAGGEQSTAGLEPASDGAAAPDRPVDQPPADAVGSRLRPAGGDAPPPAEPARPSASMPLAVPDHRGRQVTARLVIGAAGGTSSVRIELEPADLGRVEVALHLADGGTAVASFTVDRPETLQLLQRDARTVSDMLSAAGFSVDAGSLGFSLRDGGGNAGQPDRPHHGPAEPGGGSASAETDPGPRAALRHGLLDLRV